MSNADALQYEELIGTYETIKDMPFAGIDFYKKSFVDVDGDTAEWDEFTTVRQADGKLKSRGAPSSSKNLESHRERTSKMGYFNENFMADGDNLNNLRKPGSRAKDNAGKNFLSRKLKKLKDMERRTEERLLFSLFTGTLTYTLDDVAQSIDMGTAAGNKPTVGTTWATSTTNIIGDILAYKAVAVEGSGRAITTAWVNQTVVNYLLNNDSIQQFVGGNGLGARMVRTGEIGVIAGVKFIQNDAVYYNGSTTVNFVPDDVVFMTPDPDDWLSYQKGSVTITENDEMKVVPSPGMWAVTSDDPVGKKVIVKSCFLPVLTAPDAIVYVADVTP